MYVPVIWFPAMGSNYRTHIRSSRKHIRAGEIMRTRDKLIIAAFGLVDMSGTPMRSYLRKA
jgi:hypothetical protein